MGYYTQFTIEVMTGDDVVETKEFQEIFKETVGVEYEEYLELKWYDWEEDMKKISKHFPTTIFHIDANGEDFDDFWEAQIWNNQVEVSTAELIYPPFKNSFKENLAKNHPEAML